MRALGWLRIEKAKAKLDSLMLTRCYDYRPDPQLQAHMLRIFLIASATSFMFTLTAFAESTQHAIKNSLEVVVDGVTNSHGNLRIALFSTDDAALFPDRLPPLKQVVAAISQDTTFHFTGLAAGHYAVLVFHDENSNEILDQNFFGIPKEPWAVTGKRPFGSAPRFADSTFMLNSEHQKITLHLE